MGMEKYLIAVDLDDTFLTSEKHISETSIKYAKKLYKLGSYFVINTGRPFQGADGYLRELGINIPIIATNGGAIVFFKEDLYTVDKIITFEMDNKIWHELFERTLPILYSVTATSVYNHYSTDYSKVPTWVVHHDPRVKFNEGLEKVRNGSAFIDSEFYVLKKNADEFEKIINEYKDYLKYIRWTGDPLYDSFEVSSLKADKGQAMLELAKILGIKEENTFGFGDQLNDLPLIKAAHYGVAMNNGVDKVKEEASYISDYDHNNDGVIKFVQKITQL